MAMKPIFPTSFHYSIYLIRKPYGIILICIKFIHEYVIQPLTLIKTVRRIHTGTGTITITKYLLMLNKYALLYSRLLAPTFYSFADLLVLCSGSLILNSSYLFSTQHHQHQHFFPPIAYLLKITGPNEYSKGLVYCLCCAVATTNTYKWSR